MRKVIGIDEAGRGCWAGPLVAAAVLLTKPIDGLRDSKLLSAAQRRILAEQIKLSARYGLGWATAKQIDDLGLTAATRVAMSEALAGIDAMHDEIVIDGTYDYLAGLEGVRTLAKADNLIPAVSAASILAKVTRDNYMQQLAVRYPAYQFDRHVGYGTALHQRLLKRFGPSDEHRLSYKPLQLLIRTDYV